MIYSTKDDAIQREILPALGEFAADHDIDAIFDECFEYQNGGYVQTVSESEFYEIARKHSK